MTGPAGMLALVLAEGAAGGAAILFLTPLWNEVRRRFFLLTGGVVFVLALAAAVTARAGTLSSFLMDEAIVALQLSLVLTLATLVWLVLIAVRLSTAGRLVGIATVPLAVVTLVAFARTGADSFAVSIFELLAGAAFMGAVVDGLLLGHWYLTDRKLTRAPINRMAWILLAAVLLEAVAVIVGSLGGDSATRPTALNPLLTIAGSSRWIALGMVACTALIAVMIRLTLRGSRPTAVQSATGFFYLAVITAFTAELAAKVGFLPS
ncbi:MAG TPA: hypothetical protein VHI54_07265 [Actinomycetota bacterium]|nr:hypothetical protein [Actinomycetota bacterium]